MSRRSPRLAGNGYYQPRNDTFSSSGSSVKSGAPSYKETPIKLHKKRSNSKWPGPVPGVKRSPSNSSVNSLSSYISNASKRSQHSQRSLHLGGSSNCQEPVGLAYSESFSPLAKLWGWISLLSPEKALHLVYWWLGTAWYQLTTAISLIDVFTLSRCVPHVKKWMLLVLLALLGIGVLMSSRGIWSRAENPGALESTQEVKSIVEQALKLYSADRVGLVDYALESAGGSVIHTRCTETLETKTALLSLFGFPLWYQSRSPRAVIQPEVHPGNCWPFKGSQGFVVIELAEWIWPTAFTLEHIPRSISLGGSISSAPQDFSVHVSETYRI
ncbi:SUN domain-containing protein 2-like [Amblyraja radiata]|uniref:SUN domain-containing protein 2-like n=1 Tax=Amblyraja radiata TaxID=386614 RepID=UPI0014026449|nr:SUN domain-containing protein 2-like [Amblyraja radiata]